MWCNAPELIGRRCGGRLGRLRGFRRCRSLGRSRGCRSRRIRSRGRRGSWRCRSRRVRRRSGWRCRSLGSRCCWRFCRSWRFAAGRKHEIGDNRQNECNRSNDDATTGAAGLGLDYLAVIDARILICRLETRIGGIAQGYRIQRVDSAGILGCRIWIFTSRFSHCRFLSKEDGSLTRVGPIGFNATSGGAAPSAVRCWILSLPAAPWSPYLLASAAAEPVSTSGPTRLSLHSRPQLDRL